jgi:DNA-binding NarL/FixJ family response regulator
MIRILLVDDHEVVHLGLKILLHNIQDCEVCGEAGNGQEGVDRTLQLKPDVVLMDISMPVLNGLEAAKVMRRVTPETKIIMLTMHDSPQMAAEARLSGAHAFLTKACPVEQLRSAIADVCKDAIAQPAAPDPRTADDVAWSCPACGVSGHVKAPEHDDVTTVETAIRAAHKVASPNCVCSEDEAPSRTRVN